jgi:hypothetical protein
LRYPHGAYTRRRSVLLPACAHSSLREANIAHSIHTHNTRKSVNQNCAHATPNSQIRGERKPELCTRNTQFTNPKEHTHTHRGTHKRWWVEVKGSREVGRVDIITNCGCEWGSRQVSTISDAGTRYALRLSQIQEYYSVDLSVSVSVCGSLGVFITYVEEGFFSL